MIQLTDCDHSDKFNVYGSNGAVLSIVYVQSTLMYSQKSEFREYIEAGRFGLTLGLMTSLTVRQS